MHAYIIRGSYIYIHVMWFGQRIREDLYSSQKMFVLFMVLKWSACANTFWHTFLYNYGQLSTGVTCTDDLTWPFCAAICYIFRLPGLHTLYYYLYFLYAYTYTTITSSQLSI